MANYKATGKKMVEADWQIVFNIMSRPIISIEASMENGDSVLNEIFDKKEKTPETIFLGKERFLTLSEEAKEIISAIVNGPAEILEILESKKHHKISLSSIKHYLKSYKKLNCAQINFCLKELTEFTRSL